MFTWIHDLLFSATMLLIAKASMILAVTLVIDCGIYYTFRKVTFQLHKRNDSWRYVVLKSLSNPLICLVALIGMCFAINIFMTTVTDAYVTKFIPTVLKCGIVVFMTWVAISFINGAQTQCIRSYAKQGLDKTTVYAVTKLARIIVVILALLFILPIFGIGISGLIAFGSVGGAAIAFASKDLLANFFGCIIVYFDKPFVIGDWIRSPDRNIEGTVEYIGWRSCRVRTFDLRPLYVPNSLFTTISIENASRMTHRQINTTVGVRYDDAKNIKAIVDSINMMLKTHPDIDGSQQMIVNLVNFGSSSLDILVYAFTKTTDRVGFQNIQQDIYLQIIDIISSYGAQCAFPTTTLDLPNKISFPENNLQSHVKER